MSTNLQFPTIWNLIDSFKEHCFLRGWETSETEDWIKTEDGKYHNFLWTKTIHLSTFEKIALRHKCGIRRGNDYEVVDIAYMGWLFQERPPEFLASWIKDNSELAQVTAIFDFNYVYAGEKLCRSLNETDSRVFKEFEEFLNEEWNIEFKPFYELPDLTT